MTKYMTHQSPGIRIRPYHNACYYEEYCHITNRKIGGVAWKLDVGKDLNNLLSIAEELMRNPDAPFDGNRTNGDLFKAIHGIVDRIAQIVELETEAEAVEGHHVTPDGTFAPYTLDRKEAYRAIVDRFRIDHARGVFATPAAALYLAGKKEIHRFCIVCRCYEAMQHIAIADHDTMEAARKCAIQIQEGGSPDSPVVIIDLDTGEGWEADFTTIQWRAARKD